MLTDKRIKENLESGKTIIFGNSTESEQEYVLPNRCDKYDGVTEGGMYVQQKNNFLGMKAPQITMGLLKVQLTPVK